jgi:hypothetical protein
VFVLKLLSRAGVTVGLLASVVYAAQPASTPRSSAIQGGGAAAAPPNVYPVEVQLATVADHPGEFAGQALRLRSVRVDRVLSPTLVKLKDAREDGPYHFGTLSRPDRLLAVLPAGTKVAKGDVLNVAGTLRTIRGAALSRGTAGKDEDVLKHGNRPVLVAIAATTIDGVDVTR